MAALEEARGKLTDQLREARNVVGGLGSDSEGKEIDTCVCRQGKENEDVDYLGDGSEEEGLAGAMPANLLGATFVRRDWGDIDGPSKSKGNRQGQYLGTDADKIVSMTQEEELM